jgi:DNA-binding IclR family transcriptional regulator
VLSRLVARYDQSAQVAVLHEGAAQYIAAVESTQTLRVATWVGNRNALDVTAIGSALIVDWSLEQLRWMFPSFDEQGIAALAERLAVARERGYTRDEGSTEPGVLCVGAPIRDEDGLVVAALSMSVPEATMSGATVASLPTIVREAAGEVSAALQGIRTLGTGSPPS